VLEYCAKPELHPRSGLGADIRAAETRFQMATAQNLFACGPIYRPFRAGYRVDLYLRLETPGLVLKSLRDKAPRQ
jgi:hypothetical protein